MSCVITVPQQCRRRTRVRSVIGSILRYRLRIVSLVGLICGEPSSLYTERAATSLKRKSANKSRQSLQDVRIIQYNLVYVIGLPSRLTNERTLGKPGLFGKYGAIRKIIVCDSRQSHEGEKSHCAYSARRNEHLGTSPMKRRRKRCRAFWMWMACAWMEACSTPVLEPPSTAASFCVESAAATQSVSTSTTWRIPRSVSPRMRCRRDNWSFTRRRIQRRRKCRHQGGPSPDGNVQPSLESHIPTTVIFWATRSPSSLRKE